MEHPCTLQIFPFSFISRSSVCLSLLPHLYLDAQLTETHLSNFWLKVIVFLSPKQGFILSSHCLIGTIYFSFLSVFMSIIRHYFFYAAFNVHFPFWTIRLARTLILFLLLSSVFSPKHSRSTKALNFMNKWMEAYCSLYIYSELDMGGKPNLSF